MIKLNHAISLSALSLLTLTAVSCQDEDLGYTSDQIAYRANFEKTFGKVSDIPTWDFSSYNLARMGLAGGPSTSSTNKTRGAWTTDWNEGRSCSGAIAGATLGTSSDILKTIGADKYYSVESSTLNWLNAHLTEGNDHRKLGTSFKLVKPEEGKDFLIIPVYQGHSGMTWDLHLVAENTSGTLMDYKIWSHSDNIQYTKDYNEGIEFAYNTVEEHDKGGDIYWWETGGVVKGISLKRALPNFFDSKISDSDAKLIIEVPAGGKVVGEITNRYRYHDPDNNGEYTLDPECSDNPIAFTADNTSSSSSNKFEVSLAGIKSKNWYPKDEGGMWNLALQINSYVGCSFDTYTKDRVKLYTKYNYSTAVNLTDEECGSSTQNYTNRHTINRKAVKSKPMRIDCSKIKEEFFFYLDVVKGDEYVTGNDDQASTGTRQRSDEGMMLALLDKNTSDKLIGSGSTLATSVKSLLDDVSEISSCEYFVVGCEDANLKDSDWDINDVVFLIVGLDKAPKIKELVKKRYMIEDLGSTFDFDFNDIVVDVTQEKLKNVGDGTYSTTYNNNKGSRQIASIKHLCGTIPFKIQIGNSTLGGDNKVFQGCNEGAAEGGFGCNPLTHDPASVYSAGINYEIEGWKPNENNIIVTTYPNQAGWTDQGQTGFIGEHPQAEGHTFTFPETGQYPYIIACDQTVDWMPELKTIPSSWFVTNPVYHGSGNNGGSGDEPGDEPSVDPIKMDNYALGAPISVTYQSDDAGWSNYVKIGSDLSTVQVGDKIIATITNVQSGAKLLFKKTPSSGWGDISTIDPLSNTATKVTLEVTAENIDDVKSGVAVQGLGFTLTGIQMVRELNLNNFNAWHQEDFDDDHQPTYSDGVLTLKGDYQGGGWYQEPAINCSLFNNVVVEFSSALPKNGKVFVEYYDTDDKTAAEVNAGATSIKCSLSANKSKVKQIAVQMNETLSTGTEEFKMSRAYFTTK